MEVLKVHSHVTLNFPFSYPLKMGRMQPYGRVHTALERTKVLLAEREILTLRMNGP